MTHPLPSPKSSKKTFTSLKLVGLVLFWAWLIGAIVSSNWTHAFVACSFLLLSVAAEVDIEAGDRR